MTSKNTNTQEYKENLTEHNFIQCSPIPSTSELSEFYKNKYFNQPTGSYSVKYTDLEAQHFNNIAKTSLHTLKKYTQTTSLLDIGCGEGFLVSYFLKENWTVACCDYSIEGLKRQNPNLEPHFLHLGIEEALKHYKGQSFSAISLQNVLEHVIDPITTLKEIQELSGPDTIYRIRVPNDYSDFQKHFMKSGHIKNTWFCPPEHVSYFNHKNLVSLLNELGYEVLSLQADFPIELFLINSHSDYWADKTKGKGAHLARVLCENFLMNQNLDDYIAYSEAAGKIGFGRGLIAYCRVRRK